MCNYPPYLEGVSSICHISYLTVLLQFCQVFNDQLFEPFVVESSLTENCYIFCCKFHREWASSSLYEVSFRVRLILRFQRDGAPAHFRRITEQLKCWYEYRWIGRGKLQTWVPHSPDLTPFWTYPSQDIRSSWFRKRNLKWEELWRTMDASACIRNNPQVTKQGAKQEGLV